MSAFALRKKLLSQQTTPTPPRLTTTDDAVSTPSTPDTGVPRSRTPIKSRRDVQPTLSPEIGPNDTPKDSIRANLSTENAPAPGSTGDLAKSTSPSITDDEVLVKPLQALPVQLSNFKPTKANHQRRKDGRIVLKLSDGEVCSSA